MMRKGGWRPGAWEHRDQQTILIVIYVAAWVRAIDYVTGDDPHSEVNVIAEVLMPLHWWAGLIVLGATILGIGWAQRRHMLVFAGHVILGTLYMSLACGLLATYLPSLLDLFGDIFGEFLWHYGLWPFNPVYDPWRLDGIRNCGPILCIALIHWITAVRTGIEPIPRGQEEPHEVVAGTGGHDG